MEIRRARMEDLDGIMELYDQGRRFMRQSGNFGQWTDGYPQRALIEGDIRAGHCYLVLEGGGAAGVFCFFYGEDVEPVYAAIDGAWLEEGPYGVLHRVASNGRVKGLIAACTDWCLAQCPSLRVDTHQDNGPMRRALKRCGFQYCGTVVYDGEGERLAYQKVAGGARETIELETLDLHDAVLESMSCRSRNSFFDEVIIRLKLVWDRTETIELRFENCFHAALSCDLWIEGQDTIAVWSFEMPETYRKAVEKLPAGGFHYIRLDTNISGSRIELVYQTLHIRRYP